MVQKAKFGVGEEVVFALTGTLGRVQKVLPFVEETQLYIINLTLYVSEEELESPYEMPEVK